MQSSEFTYGKHALVVKKVAWVNTLFGLPALALLTIGLFFGAGTKHFFKEHIWATIIAILSIVVVTYFLIRDGFDNRTKFVISNNGIWLAKLGLINWGNIQYYYFEERSDGKFTSSLLKIRLLDSDKTISVNLSMFNTCEEDIEKAISYNSTGYNIIQLLKEYR